MVNFGGAKSVAPPSSLKMRNCQKNWSVYTYIQSRIRKYVTGGRSAPPTLDRVKADCFEPRPQLNMGGLNSFGNCICLHSDCVSRYKKLLAVASIKLNTQLHCWCYIAMSLFVVLPYWLLCRPFHFHGFWANHLFFSFATRRWLMLS